MIRKLILITVLAMAMTACDEEVGLNVPSDYEFSCEETPAFMPSGTPVSYSSTAGNASTTVIVIHGKSGSPLSSHLTPLYSDLQAAGYDVKAAYMPWGNNGSSPAQWNGTLCQAMGYVDELVQTEKSAGKQVVLIGHSMGGAGSFIYNATAGVSNPDASVIIAPGHFMHRSNVLQAQTANSVETALNMVAVGNGDAYAALQTYNNGALQDVYTTANIFLSYHHLSQYPDIVNNVLGAQAGPLFWIGGSSDSLTTNYNYASLFGSLPNNEDNQYQTIDGDHRTVVANSSDEIITWLGGLGL